MCLKGTHRYRRALALLVALASIPALARAQSGHAGHDHGGAKPSPAPAAKPAPKPAPAPQSHDDHVVGAADESMGGHHHGDMNSRFHMELSPSRPATREDSARVERLLAELRGSIARYRDTAAAVADGYKMFMPNVKTQRVFHFTNYRRAFAEAFRFDPTKPTSLLYKRGADGQLELYGAMYTAPKRVRAERLDERIPLSIARWHKHVNWCVPRRGEQARWYETRDGHPVFGPQSPIATREACDEVGGRFLASPLGWMVHVNVFERDPAKIWEH